MSNIGTNIEELQKALKGQAEFLSDRIDELDWSGTFSDFVREWNGHVEPALSRLRGTLAALASKPLPPTDDVRAEITRLLNVAEPVLTSTDSFVSIPDRGRPGTRIVGFRVDEEALGSLNSGTDAAAALVKLASHALMLSKQSALSAQSPPPPSSGQRDLRKRIKDILFRQTGADGAFGYLIADQILNVISVAPPSSGEAEAVASNQEYLEQLISAWAFAHNIDGATRNDLFNRIRALSPKAMEAIMGEQSPPPADDDVERVAKAILNALPQAVCGEGSVNEYTLARAALAAMPVQSPPPIGLVEGIYRVLREYRLTNIHYEGTDDGYPLVDAVSNEAPAGIDTGEEQLRNIAAEIADSIAPARPLDEEAVEHAARAIWDLQYPTGTSWDDWAAQKARHPNGFDGRDNCRKMARAVLALATPSLPEGMVMVPREPTTTMIAAAEEAWSVASGSDLSGDELVAVGWRAMIATAPASALRMDKELK